MESDHKMGTLILDSNSGLGNFSVQFALLPLKDVPPVNDCESDSIYPKELEQRPGVFLTANVLMLGTPRAFPDDWYQLDDEVAVFVSGKQLSSTLIVTSRDEDFELSASVYSPNDRYSEPDRLAFTIRRPVVLILYTYVVATMPFLLLVIVFFLMSLRRGTVSEIIPEDRWLGRHRPEAFELAFGVAATLVAILPLRTVLVPPSLPNPTRLDIYFGTEAVFLVALSAMWVFLSFFSPKKLRGAHEDGDSPTAHNESPSRGPGPPPPKDAPTEPIRAGDDLTE